MNIQAVNRATGEVIDLPANTPEEIVQAWNIAKESDSVATAPQDQLKKLVPNLVNEQGVSDEVNGYVFRVSNVQRKTYDKAVLRQQLDEDTFDLFMKPDKTAIDKYLRENLEDLGEASTIIRNAMIDDGKPYQVIKLEKVIRD